MTPQMATSASIKAVSAAYFLMRSRALWFAAVDGAKVPRFAFLVMVFPLASLATVSRGPV
jgi:hypothetical protein